MDLGNSASPQFHDLPKQDIHSTTTQNGHLVSGIPALPASPNAFPDSNRRAVMQALKNLQDKIRKLESERQYADSNLRQLEDVANRNGHNSVQSHTSAVSSSSVSPMIASIDARNEEVQAQLRFAESRCRMLETQLEYLRKMLQNTEHDRLLVLRSSADFAQKLASERNLHAENSISKADGQASKLQAEHLKIAEIEAQLREEEARRRELLTKVDALRAESEARSASVKSTSFSKSTVRSQVLQTNADTVSKPQLLQRNLDIAGTSASNSTNFKTVSSSATNQSGHLQSSGGLGHAVSTTDGSVFATNSAKTVTSDKIPLPVNVKDEREHQVRIEEHLHVDYDSKTHAPRAAVYDMHSLCTPVGSESPPASNARAETHVRTNTQTKVGVERLTDDLLGSQYRAIALGRAQRDSQTKPKQLDTVDSALSQITTQLSTDSSPTTSNEEDRHRSSTAAATGNSNTVHFYSTAYNGLPPRSSTYTVRPVPTSGELHLSTSTAGWRRSNEITGILRRSASGSTSASRSASASRSPPFDAAAEQQLSLEVQRMLCSPPQVSDLSPPRPHVQERPPLASAARDQYFRTKDEIAVQRDFDAQIERAREREKQLDYELQRIRERERERGWRVLLERDADLRALGRPSTSTLPLPDRSRVELKTTTTTAQVPMPMPINATDYSALLSLLRDVELEMSELTEARTNALRKLEKNASSLTSNGSSQLVNDVDRLDLRLGARRRQADSLRRYLHLHFGRPIAAPPSQPLTSSPPKQPSAKAVARPRTARSRSVKRVVRIGGSKTRGRRNRVDAYLDAAGTGSDSADLSVRHDDDVQVEADEDYVDADGDDEDDENGRVEIVTTVRARGRNTSPILVSSNQFGTRVESRRTTGTGTRSRAGIPQQRRSFASSSDGSAAQRASAREPHYSATTASFRQKRSMPRSALSNSCGASGYQTQMRTRVSTGNSAAAYRTPASLALGAHSRMFNTSSIWN